MTMTSRDGAPARFHLEDGRRVEFAPIRCSVFSRRAGEILAAVIALALAAFLLFSGCVGHLRGDSASPEVRASGPGP